MLASPTGFLLTSSGFPLLNSFKTIKNFPAVSYVLQPVRASTPVRSKPGPAELCTCLQIGDIPAYRTGPPPVLMKLDSPCSQWPRGPTALPRSPSAHRNSDVTLHRNTDAFPGVRVQGRNLTRLVDERGSTL